MKTLRILVVLGVLSLSALTSAKANLLNLPGGQPDFAATAVTVTYNATTDLFTASGQLSEYINQNGDPVDLYDLGEYTLTATINSAGSLTGGSLLIRGDLDGSGIIDLLTANLVTGVGGSAFGFTNTYGGPNGSLFEFLFSVTGGNGDVVTDVGPTGGVIVYAPFSAGNAVTFNGSWATTTGFTTGSGINNTIDAFSTEVPEPSSMLLAFLGLGLTVVSRHRATAFFSSFRKKS